MKTFSAAVDEFVQSAVLAVQTAELPSRYEAMMKAMETVYDLFLW
jgi:hypothetical protein